MTKPITYDEAIASFRPTSGYEPAWELLKAGKGPLEVARLTGVPIEDVDQLNEVFVKAARKEENNDRTDDK